VDVVERAADRPGDPEPPVTPPDGGVAPPESGMPLHPPEPHLLERPRCRLLALEDEVDLVAALEELADDGVEEAQVAAEVLHEEEDTARPRRRLGRGLDGDFRRRCDRHWLRSPASTPGSLRPSARARISPRRRSRTPQPRSSTPARRREECFLLPAPCRPLRPR